jgi:hypothetical protein
MRFKVGSIYRVYDFPKEKMFRYMKITKYDRSSGFVVFDTFYPEPILVKGPASMTVDVWEYYILRGKAIRCLDAELAKLHLLGIA